MKKGPAAAQHEPSARPALPTRAATEERPGVGQREAGNAAVCPTPALRARCRVCGAVAVVLVVLSRPVPPPATPVLSSAQGARTACAIEIQRVPANHSRPCLSRSRHARPGSPCTLSAITDPQSLLMHATPRVSEPELNTTYHIISHATARTHPPSVGTFRCHPISPRSHLSPNLAGTLCALGPPAPNPKSLHMHIALVLRELSLFSLSPSTTNFEPDMIGRPA